MGHSHKIAISIDDALLADLDQAAKRNKVSRSRYVRDAVSAQLRAERRREIGEQLDAAYSDPEFAEEQRLLAERLLSVSPVSQEAEEW